MGFDHSANRSGGRRKETMRRKISYRSPISEYRGLLKGSISFFASDVALQEPDRHD
ncbi:hypothetical protein CBM2633_B60327 [Cupriavidus taiwanensis]|nr:hypothetical protein CBM2633_B60327 [Cupriavidus taiwanensis]